MSEEKLRQYGGQSELMSDLYALKQFFYESEINPKIYYLERIEGAFQRPSFLIKIVSFNVIPKNDYFSILREDVLINYYAEDYFDAQDTSMQVLNLLTRKYNGTKDVILPRYDFTKEPPEKYSVTGINSDGSPTYSSYMGCRIDPGSLSVSPFQEPDEKWTVAITFTMDSPRIPVRVEPDVIKKVSGEVHPPRFYPSDFILESGISSTISIEDTP